jgi:hypothetical protein
MFASLSAENMILEGLRDLDMTVFFLSSCQDELSHSRIAHGLSGAKPLTNEQSARLLKLVREFQSLAAEHQPLPLRWCQPSLYKAVLAERREQR